MAGPTVDESKMILRMSDFTSEPKRILPPIIGYEKEPLVSLEQAIKPLHSLVPDVEQMVWTVKQNCQHPAHNLSSDESAAIMLYTLGWLSRESSFYFIFNNVLRSQNRQELLPWFLYLRLFMYALSKVPSVNHRTVYRGMRMDVGDEFPDGRTFIWWAFSSCSSSIKVLKRFLGPTGHRTIFNIECDSAKDITQHSFYKSENEVLMYPARQFQVVSSFNSGNELQIIQVKEIQPPFPLIHIPATSSASMDQSKTIEPLFSVMHISQLPSTKITYQNKRLQQLIEECDHESEVNLRGQNLTDEDMTIVVREAIINKRCNELDLVDNNITSVGVSIIAEALQHNNTLKNLYFTRNRFGDLGVQIVAKTLSLNNCKIRAVCFQSTGMTDDGVKCITEMLKTNTTVDRLLLGDNEISDRGVKCLANVLTYHNTTLVTLLIDRNILMSDLSADYLVEMLQCNKTLERLYIYDCNLSENGKTRLRQIAKSKKDFDLDV